MAGSEVSPCKKLGILPRLRKTPLHRTACQWGDNRPQGTTCFCTVRRSSPTSLRMANAWMWPSLERVEILENLGAQNENNLQFCWIKQPSILLDVIIYLEGSIGVFQSFHDDILGEGSITLTFKNNWSRQGWNWEKQFNFDGRLSPFLGKCGVLRWSAGRHLHVTCECAFCRKSTNKLNRPGLA